MPLKGITREYGMISYHLIGPRDRKSTSTQ